MGPVHPSQLKQPPLSNPNFTTDWAPQTDPSRLNPDFSNRTVGQANNPWTMPPDRNTQPLPNANGFNQPTRSLTFSEEVALRKAQIEQDKIRQDMEQRKAILDARERDLIQKTAAVSQQQQELERQKYLDSLRTSLPSDVSSEFSKPRGPIVGSNVGTGPVIARNDNLGPIVQNPNPARAGETAPPNRKLTNTDPRRSAGGIKDYAASLPGTNLNQTSGANENQVNATKQDRRVEGFVMFMLFCSLGLNIYLFWISRGFYVRYNELADELRETFTASM